MHAGRIVQVLRPQAAATANANQEPAVAAHSAPAHLHAVQGAGTSAPAAS